MRETGKSVTYPSGATVNDTYVCHLQFNLPNDLQPPVLLYYQLTNFYQNHRRYVQSFDQSQLAGNVRTADQIGHGNCSPLTNDNATGLPYYPCGLIANSIFNDTISKPKLIDPQGGNNGPTNYTMTTSGIGWGSDATLYGKTKYNSSQMVPPPNWRKRYPNYTDYPVPDLSQDESFWVWMRTAGLPAFSKLAMRNDNAPMLKGTYQITIWDGTSVLVALIIANNLRI
jgi:LEM3 (ligand-effect modulator 3) family / CDC50 family